MTTIVTRAGKGSGLSWAEMDANLNNLNDDKLEAGFPASDVANIQAGTITATNVQDAIQELDTKKVSKIELASDIGSELVGFKQDGTGAVLRTLESKVKEFVSVKDFGAVGDGVTDDTVSIQSAINTGKRVRVPEGDLS